MTAFAAPLPVRDVNSLDQGEQVTVHKDGCVSRTGQWLGVTGLVNPQAVVVVPSLHVQHDIFNVPIDSDDMFVTDGGGRVIRRPTPEPDLAGDFPALE